MMQRTNVDLEDQLFKKVGQLYKASMSLRNVIVEDKSSWNSMQCMFDDVSGALKKTVGTFNKMKRSGGMCTVLYLSGFIFIVLWLFYFLFL